MHGEDALGVLPRLLRRKRRKEEGVVVYGLRQWQYYVVTNHVRSTCRAPLQVICQVCPITI